MSADLADRLSAAVRAGILVCVCATIARCGGNPVQPPPPPPNTAPVVRSVTASRAQVDAGQDVEVTAVADDAQTPADLLQYEWTAEPSGGTFSGQGRIVRWRAPTDGPVPSDYALRVTVRDLTLSASMATSPIRVNDGIREMRQLADTFLIDFADSSKSPQVCVRNFTDSCRGKAEELEDIQRNRRDYTIIRETHRIDSVALNSHWVFCTAPTGPPSCALVIAPVEWVSRDNFSGKVDTAIGRSFLTGVFEGRQWWLCDSRFFEPETLTARRGKLFLR